VSISVPGIESNRSDGAEYTKPVTSSKPIMSGSQSSTPDGPVYPSPLGPLGPLGPLAEGPDGSAEAEDVSDMLFADSEDVEISSALTERHPMAAATNNKLGIRHVPIVAWCVCLVIWKQNSHGGI
jgi:hypothetical protein